MNKLEIKLKNTNDIRTLVYASENNNVCGTIEGNRSKVSITSILGLFTLDMTQPHIINVCEKKNSRLDDFIKELRGNDIEVAAVMG